MVDDFFTERLFAQEPIKKVTSEPFRGAFHSENGTLYVAMEQKNLEDFVQHYLHLPTNLHAPKDFYWPIPLIQGKKVEGVSRIKAVSAPQQYFFDKATKKLSYLGIEVAYTRPLGARLRSLSSSICKVVERF